MPVYPGKRAAAARVHNIKKPAPSPSSLNLIADVTKEINPDSLPDFDAVIHGVSDSTDGPSLASHLKISKSILSSLNIADFALKKKSRKSFI